METNKQSKELDEKIEAINQTYNVLRCFFLECDWTIENIDALDEVLEKAKAWDIFKAKCSKGAKVACSNLSKKERIERARQAGYANAKRIEKEKQRKRQNQINKHRI